MRCLLSHCRNILGIGTIFLDCVYIYASYATKTVHFHFFLHSFFILLIKELELTQSWGLLSMTSKKLCLLIFLNRSCWLELSELCVTGKRSPPSWQRIDPTKSVYRTADFEHGNRNDNRDENKIKTRISNLNLMNSESENLKDGNDARICYLCFLTHYYLELQQGENAIKILEGVLQVFPNSLIATSQV